ncbi:hypothetical protein [Streptomyces asiaticus]
MTTAFDVKVMSARMEALRVATSARMRLVESAPGRLTLAVGVPGPDGGA